LTKVCENFGAYPEEQKGGRKLKLERKKKKKVGPNERKKVEVGWFHKIYGQTQKPNAGLIQMPRTNIIKSFAAGIS
jgi:hypothetical protein